MGMRRGGWSAFLRYNEDVDQPKVSWALIKRVARYARPYWWRIVVLLLAITFSSALDLISPLLYRDLLDNALPNADSQRLNLLALGLVGLPIVTRLIGIGQTYLSSVIGEGVIYDLRKTLYAHLQKQSLRFFTHTKTGEMMSRLNSDVQGAQQAITSTMVNLITNVISLVSTLIVMISLDWRLTLVGVSILPLLVLPSRRIGRILRRVTRRYLDFMAQMNTLMNETLNISGALLVKIFGRGPDEIERFNEKAQKVRDIGIQRSLIGRWFFLGMGLVGAVGTAVVFWIGGHLVLQGSFTIGTIIAFTSYLRQLYGPLTALTNARVEFATSLVSFERVFEVVDLPVEIYDRENAVSLVSPEGAVEFRNVSFRYLEGEEAPFPMLEDVDRMWGRGVQKVTTKSGAHQLNRRSQPVQSETKNGDEEALRWALQDINFIVQPGQLAALVGPSGAGKTTITYLLPRLYDPTEGQIYLDGINLKDIKLSSLSSTIGMVTQETYLFHDTIKANLLYANLEASQEELESACRAANIHDFIEQLTDGYDTIVGERGYRLSGGEKQRIAIARVILKDPEVLILDEATSHLDSESEALIQEALQGVMKNRTSLVIAHRLSTILSADKILVLDEGKLVEQGTHHELLERNGLYSRLYARQFHIQSVGQNVE
jgi:ATP-binding cassette subfamily B protein